MTTKELVDWYDKFEVEYVEGRKPIRGTVFSGTKIEIYPSGDVTIEMNFPAVRGKTQEERTVDMIRQIGDENPNRTLFIDMRMDDLEKIVRGEKIIQDSDWTWDDE